MRYSVFFEKVKEIADADPQLAKRYSSYFESVREIADTNTKLAESLQRKAVSEFFETFPDTAGRCWPALMELEKRICAMLDTETTMESNDDIYIINAIIEMMAARKCPNEELFAFFMKNMPKLASYSLDIPLHSNQIWIPFCQFDFEQQGQLYQEYYHYLRNVHSRTVMTPLDKRGSLHNFNARYCFTSFALKRLYRQHAHQYEKRNCERRCRDLLYIITTSQGSHHEPIHRKP